MTMGGFLGFARRHIHRGAEGASASDVPPVVPSQRAVIARALRWRGSQVAARLRSRGSHPFPVLRAVGPTIVDEMRRATAVLVGLGLAGCSLAFPLDGYEGRDAGAGDGGASPSGGDATSEAGDATPDSGAWCDGARFCDDFDDPARGSVLGKWSSVTSPARGGLIEISNARAKSPPNALHVSLPAQAQGESNAALLQIDVPLAGSSAVALDFDLFLVYEPSSYGGDAYGNTLDVIPAGYSGAIDFGGWSTVEYSYYPRQPDGTNVATSTKHQLGRLSGGWHHIRIDATFRAAGRIALAVDQAPAFDDENVAMSGTTPPSLVSFTFGLGLSGQAGATETFIDNVQIR
jgi:hypothetical protein